MTISRSAPKLRDQLGALFQAGQVQPIALGVNHQVGVRVEGEHGALAAKRARAPHRAADQVLVPAMDAIERADRQDRGVLVDRM